MKGDLYLFDDYRGRGVAAWVRDGRLHDLLVDPPAARVMPGTVFRARATRPMKGMGGALLDGPEGPLFLRKADDLAPGTSVVVQVLSIAEPGKAPPVTRRLTFKGRFAIATPGAPGLNISKSIRDEEERLRLREIADPVHDAGGPGLILRSEAEGADEDAIAAEARALLDLARTVSADTEGAPERLLDPPDARTLALRDWPAPDSTDDRAGALADHGALDLIDATLAPEQPLPGGGRMTIEPTRALVAVDIDTGTDTSPAAGLKATLAAARDLPRVLRLKGLGGQIVIDPAPLAKKDRRQVEQALTRAFRDGGIETALLGWTPGGLIELQRKRERLPLSEALA